MKRCSIKKINATSQYNENSLPEIPSNSTGRKVLLRVLKNVTGLRANQVVLQRLNPANDVVVSAFKSLETATTAPSVATVNLLRKEDFPEICRFCLSRGKWSNISDLKFVDTPHSVILSHVMGSQINLDDEMPKKVCEACSKEIIQFYTFKRDYEEAQIILQSVLSTDSEPTEEPFLSAQHEDRSATEDAFNNQKKSCEIQNISLVTDKYQRDDMIKEKTPIGLENTENLSVTEKDGNNKPRDCNSKEEHNYALASDAKNEGGFVLLPHDSRKKIKSKSFTPKIYVCSCKKTFILKSEYLKCQKELPTDNSSVSENDENINNADTLNSDLENEKIDSRKKTRSQICVCSCKKTFASTSEYEKHRKEFPHCRPTEICKICDKVFNQYSLRRHMRSHTKEQPFVCEYCSMKFSEHGNLKRHIMTHTGEKPYTCDYCDKAFIQSCTLKAHLLLHSRAKPYTPRKPRQPIPQDVSTVCEICNKVYSSRASLGIHLLTHGNKDFLCSECGKSFYSKQALLSHSRIHTGEKPFRCRVCSRSFSHQNSLAIHLKIHTGQKPYVCEVCGTRFTQSTHLKLHKRVHSREKPYSCSHCGKSFSRKENLRVHVRTHTGETPYLCELCSKGFHDSTNLKKHLKRHKGKGARKQDKNEENV